MTQCLSLGLSVPRFTSDTARSWNSRTQPGTSNKESQRFISDNFSRDITLSAERLAAAASGLCIRVAELESASYERVAARFEKNQDRESTKI